MTAWDRTVEAWSHPPVEGAGYVSANELLAMSDGALIETVAAAQLERYTSWRNEGGRWVDTLHGGVDGATVLDFGCGFGLESLCLAGDGADMILADIAPANVALADRVLRLHGYPPPWLAVIERYWPFLIWPEHRSIDVFYCNGVLHHIPWATRVMERAHQLLRPDGEARLMLYTDQAWREATGTEPPHEVTCDPQFERYVRHMDGVGLYADYYTPERLVARFGRWFDLGKWVPLGPTGSYAAAILHPRTITGTDDDPLAQQWIGEVLAAEIQEH